MTTGFSERAPQGRCLVALDAAEWRARSAARRRQIAEGLRDPPRRASAAALAASFEVNRVVVAARRPPDLQDYPELAVRIRGAFGRVLHAMGPPVFARKDYGARPRAWDVLFEPMGGGNTRAEVPKPFVVQADVRGERVLAGVSLFGLAGFWNLDAAAALVGALEGGIALWERGRMKVPLECLDVRHARIAGFDPAPSAVGEARLIFRTPVQVRAGGASASSPASLLISLLNRVARLAAWQGLRLDADWNALHGAARRLAFDAEGLVPFAWTRGTQRAQGRIPVIGSLGVLAMRGNLDPLLPFLQIGEAVHAGSHASIGLGRYELSLLP